MTGFPTQDSPHLRRPTSAWTVLGVFAVSFASTIGAVRDWTDVKIAMAVAAALCVRSRRVHVLAGLAGVFLGHVVLGSLVDVAHRPIAAWLISGALASIQVALLVGILRSSIADLSSRLPSLRMIVFVLGAGALATVGGFTESWLLGIVDPDVAASAADLVFGVAIGACLAAIATTRSGSEWLSSSRTSGAELLAPLMVVLVTLVAVQVTRQVWPQRDDQRLESMAGSVQSAIASRWDRETQVLRATAESITPGVAFETGSFRALIEPFLEDNEAAIAAALGTRRGSAGEFSVIEVVHRDVGPMQGDFADDLWDSHVAEVDDPAGAGTIPAILDSVDLVATPDGSQLVLVVAFSLQEVVRSATNEVVDRVEDVVIGMTRNGGAQVALIQNGIAIDDVEAPIGAGSVRAGSLQVGGETMFLTVTPTSAFESPTWTLLAIVAIEIGVGLLLCGVLILGANAQYKMTQERRRRENLLEAALDATPGFSVVFDKDFRVLAANRPVRLEFADRIPGLEVARVFGLESDSGRRRMVEDVLRRALAGEPAQIEIAEDASVTGESKVGIDGPSSPTNHMKIIELSAYPVTSPGGEPVGFLHGVDATERRSVAMRSAQSERMESLGALAGGLAHDFNNLLFVTLGNLQLMAMNETVVADEKLSKFVSRSMSAVERGAEITKSLLAVARSQPLEESAVSLSELVKGILPLVRQALGAGRRVDVDIADPSLQLMVDSGRLSSCILNLAFNSRDAMGPNGTLRISARLVEESEMIELSISDDGAGMPPDVVTRAFEPFFTTKSPGSGTGLGLATVYAFAKQSGGTAYLESRIGAGTTVTLVLPRFSGVAVTPEAVATRRSGRRVVVADDEQSLAEMVAAWLIDMGIDARFATSPKAALELIESFEPDVLVSDANFGEELDGIELARLGTAIVPEMAVVFMTGYSTSMRELQELGERTLAKPFSREDLYAALTPLIAPEESGTSNGAPAGSGRKKGASS